jgi:hypothetical protein
MRKLKIAGCAYLSVAGFYESLVNIERGLPFLAGVAFLFGFACAYVTAVEIVYGPTKEK